MAKVKIIKNGVSCPALTNENYDYHLSGDAEAYCLCSITGKACLGREIDDPDERSSQFFSRGQCTINPEKIKRCPLYGVSKETLKTVLQDRADREYQEKINKIV